MSSKINTLKGKMVFTVTLIASILVITMNLGPNISNANALDLDSLTSSNGVSQSLDCVIIVVGCDGQGSVGSSGDTTIGSDDGSSSRATLTVVFLVNCQSTGGTPSDNEVCDKAEEVAPPSAFPNTIDAKNPNPSSFEGSSTGTVITLSAGHYRIDTDIGEVQSALEQALNTDDVSFELGASGGSCDNPESGTAQGDIKAGEKQTCIIQATIDVVNGNVDDKST